MFDLFLFFKIRNLLNKRNELIQTSYIKNFYSDYIIIENYIMRKKFNSIFDYNYEYFNKFALQTYLLYEKCFNLFNFVEFEIDLNEFENKINILDFDKVIIIKKLCKSLFLMQIDNKITLLSIEKIEELNDYIINEHKQFVEYDLNLLNDYTYEEIKQMFKINLSTNHFLKKLTSAFIEKDLNKQKNVINKLKFNTLNVLDLTNKIYFCDNFQITRKRLESEPYFCVLGGVGSGKTFMLNHILFNTIKFFDYKYVFYFDTQSTFNDYAKKFRYKLEENKIFIINEENKIKLTIEEIYLFISFYLEKHKMLEDFKDIDIYNLEFEDILKVFKNKELELYKLKDYKSIRKYEILKDLNELLNCIEESKISLFETILIKTNSVFIFQFKTNIFYELISYFLFDYLYKSLYNRKDKETFLFLDETQKYLESNIIKQKLIKLMQEKRQYKFRMFYTSLNYETAKNIIKYTNNLILNDVSDVYLKNMLLQKISENDLKLARQKEKIITDKDFSKIQKIEFKNVLFN